MRNLFVAPSSLDLAGAEIELVSVVARERRLIRALDRYVDEHPVDYVLLDCPPSLGLLTLNALVAASEPSGRALASSPSPQGEGRP